MIEAGIEEERRLLAQRRPVGACGRPLAAHRESRPLGASAGLAGGVEILPVVDEPTVVSVRAAAVEVDGATLRTQPVDSDRGDGADPRFAVGALALEQHQEVPREQCAPYHLRQAQDLAGRWDSAAV